MITISYAILACNEYYELHKLLTTLAPKLLPDDEIVVVLDTDNVTDNVKALCKDFSSSSNFHYYYGHLNNNFADHKNFLNSKCTKDWIFNIDADEYPSELLLDNIREILKLNESVDVISVPRVNIVNNITPDHITKWGWKIDDRGRINWPDYQLRIFKNSSKITWTGKIHEKPIGWKIGSEIPSETDDLVLMHIKDIKRQEIQNSLYASIQK